MLAPPPIAGLRELARTWQAVLGRLEFEVSTHNFDTWLRGTRPLRLEGDTLFVEARTALNCDWLNVRLALVVERALCTVVGKSAHVQFVPRGASDEPEPGALVAAQAPPPAGRLLAGHPNCSFTFERYLRGDGNRLALECCLALVEGGDPLISPVVLVGPPGIGKSHLLHALACRAVAGGWAVTLLNAEEFTSRYLAAIRRGTIDEFHAVTRTPRLLALDDLQYLAGKPGTQNELVHAVDAVANAGGHVVVASERHPFDLDLPERLATRLAAGMVARLEPFALADRHRFAEEAARGLRCSLPGWAIARIAAAEASSVRILQGAVHAAATLARCGLLDPGRLDSELARTCLAEARPALAGRNDDALLEAIAHHFSLTTVDLTGRGRTGRLAEARSVAAAALRERGRSLAEVASLLGNRDRSTVRQLARRGADQIGASSDLRRLLAG
ncbi:MAG: ATP-binding protein [Dehalococcoidia bacterium]|nr:ATP-binding protein [Dehalococcoidia bacterium]